LSPDEIEALREVNEAGGSSMMLGKKWGKREGVTQRRVYG
jgi:hypothetical protein